LFFLASILLIAALPLHSPAQTVNLQQYGNWGYTPDTIVFAILPFSPLPGSARLSATDSPDAVLHADLATTGRYNLVRRDRINAKAAAAAHVRLHVSGDYAVTRDSSRITWRLFDSRHDTLIAMNTIADTGRNIRFLAHRMANQFHYMIYQEKGIFESRIAFVRKSGSRWQARPPGHRAATAQPMPRATAARATSGTGTPSARQTAG